MKIVSSPHSPPFETAANMKAVNWMLPSRGPGQTSAETNHWFVVFLLILFNSTRRERTIVRQWLVALIVWISECATCYGQTPLLLFGDNEHQTFLGCLNCSKFDSASICNKFGQLGSLFTSDSIWNASGRFGSKFSSDSPWNVFSTSGPVIVDESGQFYGRFTASKFVSDRTRIRALNQLTDLVAGGTSLRDAHERFCGD